MAVVYWLKAPHHSDYNTEGYIGVSVKTAQGRYAQHRSAALRGSNLFVHTAIRKYGSLEVVTLAEGDEEFCYLVEEMLRPHQRIGYNLAQGGGVSPTSGIPCTDARKEKIRARARGRVKTQEAKDRFSLAMTGRNLWENSAARKDLWAVAKDFQDVVEKLPKASAKAIAKMLGHENCNPWKLVDKIRAGWNIQEDTEYQTWLSEYKQNKEAIDATSLTPTA